MIKVDTEKVLMLRHAIIQAITKRLETMTMTGAEIQLALNKAIYEVVQITIDNDKETAVLSHRKLAA